MEWREVWNHRKFYKPRHACATTSLRMHACSLYFKRCFIPLPLFLFTDYLLAWKTLQSANLIWVFLLLIQSTSAIVTDYPPPPDCEWTSSGMDVSLTCHAHAIGSNPNDPKFSLVQEERMSSLIIVCQENFVESTLTNVSIAHLRHLKSLHIEQCKLSQIPDSAFDGFSQLRNLTIRTRNGDWGTLSLSFGLQTFAELKELEYLNLEFNNIIDLPKYIFCELRSLKVLDLSHNQIANAKNFGFEDNECLPNLEKLDISHNKISELLDDVFSSLRKLKVLDISDNQLAVLASFTLTGLNKLQLLDMSNNQISSLPSQPFQHCPELRELYLQNNTLTFLIDGVFSGLQQLSVLNLSHNSLSVLNSSAETLGDVIRLAILDLSHNHIRAINATTFHSQHNLQMLYLQYNKIDSIVENAFSSLGNLHTLTLSNNKLKIIGAFTFSGLYSLNYLALNYNELEKLHADAFRNCSAVLNLKIRGNKLKSLPKAITTLEFLKYLDISHNLIDNVSNSVLRSLKHLISLHLSRNQIGNLTRGTFRDLISLKALDLSHNMIRSLEHGIFDDASELRSIRLNDNFLNDINGLFMNLRFMSILNISRNKITWFDYALIPAELQILDVHDNEIDALGNYFELESVMHLRSLDISYNSLKEISSASFPNRIETIRLNNNRIRVIAPFTFMAKSNLTFAELRHNNLQTLDINALRLRAIPSSSRLPEFYISGNPYFCDCSMEWLQRINDLDETRQYPKVLDFHEVKCQMLLPRFQAIFPLAKASSSDFLCKYKNHCFALCHCCEFDACDCEMVCPENCTCYSDQTWNTNIVDCGGKRHSKIPARVPMDVTDLYMDGNYMNNLTSHSFIGRKNMKVLYLNSSNIYVIRNRTFNGLQNLLVLHLEFNKITQLQGHEFTNLTQLKELFLSNNRLVTVSNTTFTSLKFLQVLHLDHNFIVEFQVWNFNYNPHLRNLRLSYNSWTCKCNFMETFQEWMSAHENVLVDSKDVRCYNNRTLGVDYHLTDFNSTACSNYSALTYFQAHLVEEYIPLMIILPCLSLLLLFVSIVVCIYHKEVKVWIYTKYGIRLFQRSTFNTETEKIFDVFLTYCKKDEAFVAQILAPELECNNPPYRLCLRHQNLPSDGYVPDAVTEVIEVSHRTIAVVSDNFLKNEWCRYDLKAAHQETQCNKHHRLVVVLLGKISFKELDPDVRLCLRTAVVVSWGDRRFWEKLRYAMPESSSSGIKMSFSGHEKITSSLRKSSISNSVHLV